MLIDGKSRIPSWKVVVAKAYLVKSENKQTNYVECNHSTEDFNTSQYLLSFRILVYFVSDSEYIFPE
jgi:hypothetical protein